VECFGRDIKENDMAKLEKELQDDFAEMVEKIQNGILEGSA
jgi:hypothetical protein